MSETGDAKKSHASLITSRPAVILTALFAAGVLVHPQVPIHPAILLSVIAALTIIAAFLLHRPCSCTVVLSLSVILSGVAFAQHEHYQYHQNHIALFSSDDPRLAEVELRLLDEPHIITSSTNRPLPPRQIVAARVLRVKTWTGWIPSDGETILQIDQPHPGLAAGQIVRVLGMLQRPPPPMNPGEFDWSAYYRQQRILATITATRVSNVTILSSGNPSPLTWLRIKSRKLLEDGFTAAKATDAALLRAMLLGDRDPQLRDIEDEFEQTGVGYQLSVSGLHIAMLAGFLLWLCRLLCLRPRASLLITAGFVLLYGLVALPSHSGFRSVILCLAIAVATLSRRPTDHFQTLSLAFLVMLLVHPLDSLSPGFWLSLLAVVALAIFMPRVKEFFLSRRDPHKVAAGHLLKRTRLQTAIAKATSIAGRSLQIVAIIWFATLPLVAIEFGQINPWAILAGIPLLALVFIALIGGVVKIFFTLALPITAGISAGLAALPVELIRHFVDLIAKLPGAKLPLAAPPPWAIAAYYVLLLAPLLPSILMPFN